MSKPPGPDFWAIRAPISSQRYWLLALVGILVPFAAWWGVTALQLADPVFM
ncbi:MAG: hypothetical protein HGA75_15545, partial [Thiobacillus sp.]|nr:hypothetical protein [Thiobacillus sp.]